MSEIVLGTVVAVLMLTTAATASAVTTETAAPALGPPTTLVRVTGSGFDARVRQRRRLRRRSGGHCSAAPVVVNGTLYVSFADVSAYTLTGAKLTSFGHRGARRPEPRRLKPSAKLERRYRHHHRRGRRAGGRGRGVRA